MKTLTSTALFGELFCILGIIINIVGSTGCATRPTQPEVLPEVGVWQTSAQMTDLRNQKRQYASIEFIALRPDHLRLEATGPLGLKLASVAMKGNQLDYLVHLKKQAYETTVSGAGLRDGIGVPVDPRLLLNLLYDEPIRNKSWICSLGVDGKVQQCLRQDRALELAWADRNGDRKRMLVKTKTHELELVVKSFEAKSLGADAFELKIPEGYTKYKNR